MLKCTENAGIVASWLLHHDRCVRQYYSECDFDFCEGLSLTRPLILHDIPAFLSSLCGRLVCFITLQPGTPGYYYYTSILLSAGAP